MIRWATPPLDVSAVYVAGCGDQVGRLVGRGAVERVHPQIVIRRWRTAVLDAAALAFVSAGPGGKVPRGQTRVLPDLAQSLAQGLSGLLDTG